MTTDLIYWDHNYNQILLLNFAIVIALFTSLRMFSGTLAHINASDELLKKDNAAFGISLAGVTFAITILLSGTMYGTPDGTVMESAIAIGLYGLIGIVLMAITRMIFDKIALPAVSLREEIVKGNIAVAITDASNVLAAALIIRAVMVWITENTLEGIFALLAGYAISQAVLTLATKVRFRAFETTHEGRSIEEELKTGNVALALSVAGRKIGTAFAIMAASQIVVYEVYDLLPILVAWAGVSVLVILIVKILSVVAEKIILFQVDTYHEIIDQRNIAVGALQAIIYMSMAFLLTVL